MAAEFFCFILPIFSLFSLPIDCVLANILRRFFMDAKLAILQACLKVWKSGGASSKGRGQTSGGRSKDGQNLGGGPPPPFDTFLILDIRILYIVR